MCRKSCHEELKTELKTFWQEYGNYDAEVGIFMHTGMLQDLSCGGQDYEHVLQELSRGGGIC